MAMSTSSGTGDYGIFDELAEEFAERYRRGERPSLQEYVNRCPAMGDEIRELFPALVEVEQAEEVLEPRHGPAASPSAPALRQVGDYRVIREVGRGGMGVVYEAEQVSLGRRVALKILPGVVAKDRKAIERFRREARAAARLHHTNIVPVFEVGQDGEVVFYAMQFIQGQGLEIVIEELARQRQRSGQGSAAPVAAAAEEQKAGPPGTTLPESTMALSRSPAALPGRDRTEALAASLRARQVSRMARSLVSGTFAVEIVDPERSGSSNGVGATDAGDGPGVRSSADADRLILSSSASAVLPGGTQVSAVESSGRRLPFFRSVAHIGRQAAQGLAYAHTRGIIHRDIKPSNLLLDSAGVVWIADFGLAKADDDGLTATGDILGTIRYMAPERFRGEGDGRADVYALGLTLYELLTLRPGFESSDRLRMIERIKTEEPVRPRTVDNRIPLDLETIVLKAIDKDPNRRYSSADAMAEDLRRYLDDEPVLARRTTAVERYARWARHNPGVAVLGGVLTAVLLLVTAGSMIVAGNMTRLAGKEAKAARDAELARSQEADQRAVAEKARHLAEVNAKEADAQRKQAEANFTMARAAVDESFTKISESQLLTVPGMQPLRRELLSSALRFYEGFVKEHGDDPSLRAGLASALLRVGLIRRELGEEQQAKTFFEKARVLFEPLVVANPADSESAHGLAQTLFRLGRLEGAIAIWQRLVRPGESRFQRDLADAFDRLGMTNRATKWARALDALEKSLSIREMLVTLKSEDPIARRDLAGSLNNIGLVLDEIGQPEQAMPLYRRAVEQAERAFAMAPQDLTTGRFLAIPLGNCARLEKQFGRRGEATRLMRRVVTVWKSMASDNPAIPSVRTGLLYAYRDLVKDLRALGQAKEAGATIRLAREELDRLPRDGAEYLFALACWHATVSTRCGGKSSDQPTEAERADQVGEADLAMDALRQAVDAGCRVPVWDEIDPELAEALRGRADFETLVAKLRDESTVFGKIGVTKPEPGASMVRSQLSAVADPVRSAQAQENQAAARQAIGLGLLELGELGPAAECLGQALTVRQRLAQDAPERLGYQIDLAATLVGLARLDQKAGRLEQARQRWGQAAPVLTRAVAKQPDDRQAWKNLGIVRAELRQPEAAATAFDRLVELTPEPGRAATLIGLARLEQEAGRLEQARRWWGQAVLALTQAVAERPGDRQAWKDLGIVHAKLGQPEAAATAFAKLMELIPKIDDPALWWSHDPLDIGDVLAPYDEIFARLVQMRPTDRTLLMARFHFFGRRRRWREAADIVTRITELDPDDTLARHYRRLLMYHLGDFDGFRREALSNAWPEAQSYREGRYAEAIREYQHASETTSHPLTLTWNHLQLAKAHQKLGHSAGARKELELGRRLLSVQGRASDYKFGAKGEPLSYGWTEWLVGRIVLDEAEALILYDPIFPADPFAP